MEQLFLEKNNTKIQIAEIANINSKEQLVYGNYDRDLILRAKGAVTLQIQNKFYRIPLQEITTDSTVTQDSFVGFTDNIANANGVYANGYLMFDTTSSILYFFYNNKPIAINSESGTGQTIGGQFISFEGIQELTGEQRLRALTNIGASIDTYNALLERSAFENELIFVADRESHLIFKGDSWKELYLSSLHGGTVYGNVTITNATSLTPTGKATLSIPLNHTEFYTEDQANLNGLFIGQQSGLKLYSLDYANMIQGGVDKQLIITTDLSTNNIVIHRDKTSFNTENVLDYAAVNIEKGLGVDTLFVKTQIRSQDYAINDTDYSISNSFDLSNSDYGWLFDVPRIKVRDVASDYKIRSTTQTYLSDTVLITNLIVDDLGQSIATFRNTNSLITDDLFLGVVYNKTKSISNVLKLHILEVLDDYKAVVTVEGQYKSFLDLELIKIGNANTDIDINITLMDNGTKSLRTVKGVRSFNSLNLPHEFLDGSMVIDQNVLPNTPVYNLPEFSNVVNAFGDLTGIADIDLNPSGFGFYSSNAFIQGTAKLDRLILTPGAIQELDITSADVTENTNLYFTEARAIAATANSYLPKSYTNEITDTNVINNIIALDYSVNSRASHTETSLKVGDVYDDGTYTYIVIGGNKVRRF